MFAWIIPTSNTNGIIINLLSAAVAQAGANQAGDLSYDLKVGSIVGAPSDAQTTGQVAGSLFGAIISCLIYRFYSTRNPIPGPLFRIPSSYLLLSTARLLMGRGLPDGVAPFALGAAILSAIATIAKIIFSGRKWEKFIPSGVAFAIGTKFVVLDIGIASDMQLGIYNTPSFTITRALGGLIYWLYKKRNGGNAGDIALLASGLVLGESVASLAILAVST